MRLKGLGIDIVSHSRIRQFMKTHSRRNIGRLLTDGEKKHWRHHRYSTVLFSKFFAAKEAYFKALGRSWLGLEGFGRINVECFSEHFFDVQEPGRKKGQGCFFKGHKWTGAQVMVWDQ